MTQTFMKRQCWICDKYISTAGFARTAHMRKHVREGRVVEETPGKFIPIAAARIKAETSS